jgi:hypothetical protein
VKSLDVNYTGSKKETVNFFSTYNRLLCFKTVITFYHHHIEKCQNQINIFKEENHGLKCEQVKEPFNDLIDVNDCISDFPIAILWADIKLHVEKLKDQLLTTTSNPSL